jgi:hypothetical protein
MLDAVKLKEIALAKREEKKKIEKEAKTSESIVKELEDYVIAFAEDGHMAVDYTFQDDHPVQAILTVGNLFKFKNPGFMVITCEGQKKITVTWDGNNYV